MTIEELYQKFEKWREDKPRKGTPIPEELWTEVCSLAKIHGVKTIATTCQLPPGKIKAKMEGDKKEPSPIQFAKTSGHRHSIELTTPSGVSLKIY